MGYYVDTLEVEIRISKDKFDACYKAMCHLNDNDDAKRGGGWNANGISSDNPRPKELNYHPAKWFSWMDANYPDKCKNMKEILCELGFENLDYGKNGDLISFTYSNKTGQEELFFNAIAPFVNEASYITWRGEDNAQWQWFFDGEKMHIRYATIVYE